MTAERPSGLYPLIRPLLFRMDPEKAHALTLGLLRLVGKLPPLAALVRALYAAPDEPVEAFGLIFSNRVGLAAGYDKDGSGWRGLACLGFGHIEIGTVTPLAQTGNPKPRIFRLVQDDALINRMGFPGKGAEFAAHNLRGPRPAGLVLGVNLGKNRDTPLEDASRDYLVLMDQFAGLADYLAINVSSPNTVGLRRLQARQALESLLTELVPRRDHLMEGSKRALPLLVKLAPDLDDNELEDALDALMRAGVDGVIATNTTLRREGLLSAHSAETGGLSGEPLRSFSTRMVDKIVSRTQGRLPVIAVGGVMNADAAREKLDAGAVLVQTYSGLVYAGPGLVKNIKQSLHTTHQPG